MGGIKMGANSNSGMAPNPAHHRQSRKEGYEYLPSCLMQTGAGREVVKLLFFPNCLQTP